VTLAHAPPAKRLILLRHAKAAAPESARNDFERPLTERGESDARLMGTRLRARHAAPTLVVSSPARRAQRTAEIVAHALDYPLEAVALDGRLYLADPDTIMAVVAGQDEALASVLVVGHNFGISDAARRLAPTLPVDELPTAGVVALDSDAATWAAFGRSRVALRYYDFPKNDETPVRID
jgi:phosphohistidine phosphatase